MNETVLRQMRESDLPALFEIQCDAEAQVMAAFTSTANDRQAYLDKHRKLLADDRIVQVVVEADGEIVGSAAAFPLGEEIDVTYWIRRDHWGRGLAGAALAAVLEQVPVRPVFASAASDNLASQRVLERAGFRQVGRQRGFAEARGQEIEEVMFRLD
ncbi:GCN5-related N-acetyltransferase [Catenulispora acidiphila DSM 44928]|uniref:GCN5-related N-acetyltransferase n=1 Tax=Catenulispora acidiphila (strain DSM 44928 / JCM 14897 / NBRC 102108 / NRRL B-24433 / ID139908) TaxID=479433 RepID=C7PWB4_CATAD|nr:GNAT family N-acetyltransferase [Catenulispora acidiphila]ACU73362.1 GCN5-related N-acetyltransferase [Catenulispora acidiphila DSM 44928]